MYQIKQVEFNFDYDKLSRISYSTRNNEYYAYFEHKTNKNKTKTTFTTIPYEVFEFFKKEYPEFCMDIELHLDLPF